MRFCDATLLARTGAGSFLPIEPIFGHHAEGQVWSYQRQLRAARFGRPDRAETSHLFSIEGSTLIAVPARASEPHAKSG